VKKSWIVAAVGAASLVATALATGAPSASAAPAKLHPAHVCKTVVAKGEASCHALKMVDAKGVSPASTTPASTALSPAQVRAAYNLGGTSSGGKTVAIVDAYGYTNLARDLATYRSYWGLPACTTASGCLKIVDQAGGSALPRMDIGWAQEQALDVDAVSAACPDCKILVVQAKTASIVNLGTAVNTAVRLGAAVVSNSYGGGDLSDATYGSYYNHKGVAITASTGDNGIQGGSYPAASSFVTAVGGTSLKMSGTSRVSETAWSGAGSGCSTVNAALAVASTFNTGCAKRAIADVSAAADPGTGGLAVYYPSSKTTSTWGQFGGTSESAPIIASVYALGTNTFGDYPNTLPYTHTGSLFDITSGSNGTCSTTQWCNARAGWDGPTGLGTPNGVGAF
jgi:subtilase family serine protease